jgi:hypothetical protein
VDNVNPSAICGFSSLAIGQGANVVRGGRAGGRRRDCRPIGEVLRAWTPATRVSAAPRAGSAEARYRMRARYRLVAGWDALDEMGAR